MLFLWFVKANIDFVGAGKAVDWSDSVGLRGGHLSGGQKQRIAIARAILVARSKSFDAPVDIWLINTSSAIRPPNKMGT